MPAVLCLAVLSASQRQQAGGAGQRQALVAQLVQEEAAAEAALEALKQVGEGGCLCALTIK